MKYLLIILFTLSASGCIYIDGHSENDKDWRSQQKKNREHINNLSLNTPYATTLEKLGTPDYSEAFTVDESEYRILYYRTQRLDSDGETTMNETTPLVFKAGFLIGWGNAMRDSIKP